MVYKLPKTVRVGPYIYRFEQNLLPDADHHFAEHSPMLRVIRFGMLCQAREIPISLLHELFHAVNHAVAADLDEDQVTRLSNGLAQALMDLRILPEEMELGD